MVTTDHESAIKGAREGEVHIIRLDAEMKGTDPPHKVYPVALALPYSIEFQWQPTWLEDDDGREYESSYRSWGVWDHLRGDWAGMCGAASHFDSYEEARLWLEGHIIDTITKGKRL